jgi:curved DNA-binding protein CbpA
MSGKALTYYELLRVSPRAEPEGVRAAYRKLAQQYHPDKMPGNAQAEQVMAALNEAYAVLSNPQQRARYDEHLEAILASRRRLQESCIARLEDTGASWPWLLLCATIAFAAAAISISMWPALIAVRLLH